MSKDKTNQAEESTYYLPQRQFRRGPLPPGPVHRPERGVEMEDAEPEEEIDLDIDVDEESRLAGRKWRRGPLPASALDPARVDALWARRHGTDG